MIKNLPKHFFAWYEKSFSWNNHNKNFVMLSKNLLDSSKFFLTVRQTIFFWPRFDWLKTRGTFIEISNIKILKVSTNNFSVFLSNKWSLQLVYYDIITEFCYVIRRRKTCYQQIIQTKLTSHVRILPPSPCITWQTFPFSQIGVILQYFCTNFPKMPFFEYARRCPKFLDNTLGPRLSLGTLNYSTNCFGLYSCTWPTFMN